MSFDPAYLKDNNARYLWHPMASPKAMQASPPDIIVKGDGVWIWDVDGHKMVDGVGGLWSSNLGFGRKEIRDAIIAQMDELPFYNTFRGTTHARAIELSERLVRMMQPDDVQAVFFCNGGSDAVESALKIARQYWKIKGQADRTKYISLRQGYHGVHFGGMSVNGNSNFRRPYEPLLPGCFHIDTPWLYRNPYTDDPVKLGEICAQLLEREIVFQGPDTVAAFIAEPVQGAGGVIVPPENYWPLVRRICDKYGVLLIADEVVTGFGRTGAMFGTRLWGVQADLMCLAKGISSGYVPLGATTIGSKVAEAFDGADAAGIGALSHGYTYSGHPIAAAASLATLDILEKEDIPGNAARQGKRLIGALKAFEEKYRCVGEVRGKGLMVCIEMVMDKKTKAAFPRSADAAGKVARATYRNGAMVRSSGPNIILSPALVMQEPEIDLIVAALDKAFTEFEASL
ncbi:MAG TPA: aminotransferase class III-fold pyridoxal phosphate-dependent enzyme [Burkholderiaceae bacterium]|nr:aminotransferase class III-fold pyridoxal phosphate-dependent enzyme [Burkholderiaceae bacterium]